MKIVTELYHAAKMVLIAPKKSRVKRLDQLREVIVRYERENPTKKIKVHFTRINGEYIAYDGSEITTDMLMEYAHEVHGDDGFILLPENIATCVLITVNDEMMEYQATSCCLVGPITEENYCPNCGRKIERS